MLVFEWNVTKARENEVKHGVSFDLATKVFEDPKLVLAEDAAHSSAKARFFAFGEVGEGVLTVRFTLRRDRVRIIGAGYWRSGKEFYEQTNLVHG